MDSYPHQLSGGMKQRGALARALCLRPGVLLMDEPFSSLDYMTKHGLYKSIKEMVEQTGATVVMVTHDIEEALCLGTSIRVLSKESGRFSGMYDQGGDGFQQGSGNRWKVVLHDLIYADGPVLWIANQEMILGPYRGFSNVPARIQSEHSRHPDPG